MKPLMNILYMVVVIDNHINTINKNKTNGFNFNNLCQEKNIFYKFLNCNIFKLEKDTFIKTKS